MAISISLLHGEKRRLRHGNLCFGDQEDCPCPIIHSDARPFARPGFMRAIVDKGRAVAAQYPSKSTFSDMLVACIAEY